MKVNVVVVLKRDGETVFRQVIENIVTNAGDRYYAQRAAGETPTDNFDRMVLGNGTPPTYTKTSTYGTLTGAITASTKVVSTGYPRTNDTDPDNGQGGVNVVTWKFAWSKTDFAANGINQAVITIPNPTSTSPILTGFTMTAFDKTNNDTLTIFVNHQFQGV